MAISQFTPKPLTELEADVRLAALHMSLSYITMEDDFGYAPEEVLTLAESFRRFLMGLPIASEG